MSFTAYGNADNIPSHWPAGLKYDSQSARYLFSVSNAFQIAALEHLHVVAIDVVPTPPAVNVMTLTLPIQKNLPLESRIYFFYVSEATENDQLVFIPVSGSGDTVNGSPFSHTETLTGLKQLFIVLGTNGNYIIQSFSAPAPPAPPFPPPTTNPTNMYRALTAPANFTVAPSFQFPNPISSDSSGTDTGHFTSYQYVPVVDPNVYVTGMDGYITAVNTVPINGLAGFIVNHAGLYRVTYNVSFSVQSGGMANPAQQNDVVVNVSSTGTVIDYAPYGVGHRFKSPTNLGSYGCCSHIFDLDAGTYIVGTVGINQSYCAGLTYLVNSPPGVQHYTDLSTMTFELLEDREPPPAPLLLEELSPSARAASLVSPMHAPIPSSQIVKAQRDAKSLFTRSNQRAAYNSSGGSSESSGQPTFTLSDMERMISQAIDSRDRQNAAAGRSFGMSSASSSSGSSAPITRNPPASKKRKQVTLEKGEIEQ